MSSCSIVWPEENLSSETCKIGQEQLRLLAAAVSTFYYLSGGRANSVIQVPVTEVQRILDVLGQLFTTKTTEEVSEDDNHRSNQYRSPSPAEALSS